MSDIINFNYNRMWKKAQRSFTNITRLSRGHHLVSESRCLSIHTHQTSYPLPWPKSLKPVNPYSSVLDKLAGLFLLNRLVDFSQSDFLLGVKDAVYTTVEVLSDKNRHQELENLMTEDLYLAVKESLNVLPLSATMHLDIESIRHIQLCTINGRVGEASADDVFALKIFGQDIVSSEANIQTYSETILKGSKEEREKAGESVLTMKANFEVGVGFSTQEMYMVFGDSGKVLKGSNQYQTCHHLWTFSSPVDLESDSYPLDWTISDINGYLQQPG